MSRPTNSLANIKIPGENTMRPIVPYALGVSANNSYQATLPTLTADDILITAGTDQTITGIKTFSSTSIFSTGIKCGTIADISTGNGIAHFGYNDNDGAELIAPGHFIAYGDSDNNNTLKPTDEVEFEDLDTYFFNTGITLHDAEGIGTDVKLSFPSVSGTLSVVTANPSTTTATLTGITINGISYAITSQDNDHYPTTFVWTNGTTSGPTGSLTGNSGFSAVSFGAIPAASMSQSGIVTTGTQGFNGSKTFYGQITIDRPSGGMFTIDVDPDQEQDPAPTAMSIYDQYNDGSILLGIQETNDDYYITFPAKSGTVAIAEDYNYITTAPTSANNTGNLRIVVLSTEPATKYSGYLYFIT